MNITKSNLNFKGIYKFNVASDNFKKANVALDKISNFVACNMDDCQLYSDFTSGDELKSGIYQKVHVLVNDRYDHCIESILLQKKIHYIRQSYQDAILPSEIFNRIVLDKRDSNFHLVTLEVEDVERLFKKDKDYYISENGAKGAINNRYEEVKKYFKTGRQISASKINLSERDGELKLSFDDGRHRFAVMRDLGMRKIKFALDDNSLKLAEKYKLIA